MSDQHWRTPEDTIILKEHKIDWEDADRLERLMQEIKILHKHDKTKEYVSGEIDMISRVAHALKRVLRDYSIRLANK